MQKELLNEINRMRKLSNLRAIQMNEEEYEDFFYFIENDPRLNTFASLNYVSSMNPYLAKRGFADSNPMVDKIYKVTQYQFRFGQTYQKAAEINAEKSGTEYTPGERKGTYTKMDGFSVLEFDKNGDEVLPIVPTKAKSEIYVIENGNVVDKLTSAELKEKYGEYFSPSFFTSKPASSGVDFRALKVKRIINIKAGTHEWINPKNEFSEILNAVR
jgi:hypothetical protein